MTNEQGDIQFTDDELSQAESDEQATAEQVSARTGRDINEVKRQLQERRQTP